MATKKTAGKKTVAKKTVKSRVSARPEKTVAAVSLDHYLDSVKKKAYEIFQSRGAIHGSDLDDWLKAEKEVKQKYGLN